MSLVREATVALLVAALLRFCGIGICARAVNLVSVKGAIRAQHSSDLVQPCSFNPNQTDCEVPTASRFVSFSVLQHTPHYVALPITCFVWRVAHGAIPIVYVIGDSDPEPWVLEACGKRVQRVTCGSGVDMVSCSQLARLGAPSESYVLPSDLVMITDADMITLRPQSTGIGLAHDQVLVSFNGDCCAQLKHAGASFRERPMHLLSATRTTWCLVLRCSTSTSGVSHVMKLLRENGFETPRHRPTRGIGSWNLDQRLISYLLHKADVRVAIVRPNAAGWRIDRAEWPERAKQAIVDRAIDVHMPHNILPGVASTIATIIQFAFPNNTLLIHEARRWATRQGAADFGRS